MYILVYLSNLQCFCTTKIKVTYNLDWMEYQTGLSRHDIGFLFMRPGSCATHYYTKSFAQCLQIGLGGGRSFQPPQLMPRLTDEVKNSRLLKSINQGGPYKRPA
jgi:hypothetical protein